MIKKLFVLELDGKRNWFATDEERTQYSEFCDVNDIACSSYDAEIVGSKLVDADTGAGIDSPSDDDYSLFPALNGLKGDIV